MRNETNSVTESSKIAAGDQKPSVAARKGRVAEFDQTAVRDLSEKVYRDLLEADSGAGAVERMIEKDGDAGEKLRGRSASYDRLSRAYMRAMNSGKES